jgi:S-adenosylmethionine synthetase
LREEYDVASILVSGNLDHTNMEAAAGLEPVAMIGKPFMPVTIAGAINKALSSLAQARR